MDAHAIRRRFAAGLLVGVRVVWPILSALILLIVGLGILVGRVEHWTVGESIYFAFVSGLTIGYGDLAPKVFLSRTLAVAIGVCGVLFTALLAGVAVKALNDAIGRED